MSAALLEAVLGNLAAAAGLAAVAAAVGRWANRPAVAHVLWLLVLVKLLTPPVVTIPVKCLPARSVAAGPVPPAPAVAAMPPAAPVIVVEPDPPATQSSALPAPIERAVEPVAAVPVTAPVRLPSWEVVLLGVWAAGSLAYIATAVVRVQ